jgi:hypothetical protein
MGDMEFLPVAVEEPIGTYLARIRHMLRIGTEQEYALAKRWRERGDRDAEHRPIGSGTVKLVLAGLRWLIGSGTQRHEPVRTFRLRRLPSS